MSTLSPLEKRKFEKLLDMGTGYVYGFSNRTLQEFIMDVVGLDIYDSKYEYGSGSKANRLRGFWVEEPDHVVGKVMKEMIKYWKEVKQGLDATPMGPVDVSLFEECSRIAARLTEGVGAEGIDSLNANSPTRSAVLLVKDIKDSISHEKPELALDRLHTFMVEYLRKKCGAGGVQYDKETSLNALLGLFVKSVEARGVVESEMALRILKSSIQNLEAYNTVRNNQSLAHANEALKYEEAMFVCRGVINLVAFIEAIDQ